MHRRAPRPSWRRVALLSALVLCLGAPASPASAARLVGSTSGFCAIAADRGVACWGSNVSGRLAFPTVNYGEGLARPTRIAGVANTRSISSTASRVCALTFAGEILCWGSTASDAPSGRPVATVATVVDATDLVLTGNHLCVKAADRRLRCAVFMPRDLVPGEFAPLPGATRVSAITINGEGDSFCLTRPDREALCFTEAFRKADTPKLFPVQTPRGVKAVAVTRTFANTCFVDRRGRVRCTGGDPLDALAAQGEGPIVTARDRKRFRAVPGIKDATGLASGSGLCVIRRGGRLTCVNPNGAVKQRRPRFMAGGTAEIVRGIEDVREAVNTYGSTCAIRAGGAIWCWGSNDTGHGATYAVNPVPVAGLTDATSLATGSSQSCAIRRGGDVACWGGGAAGTYGARYDVTAIRVDGIRGVTAIAPNRNGTCAIAGSALRCWGPFGLGGLRSFEPFTIAKVKSETGTPIGLSGTCVAVDARVDCLTLKYPRAASKRSSARPTGKLITQPGLAQVAEVVDDAYVQCVIHVDRTVTCAGTGWLAPQSDRTSTAAGPTKMPGLTGVVKLSSGDRGACAILAGGRVTCLAGADPTFDGVNSTPFSPEAARTAGSPGHLLPGIEDAIDVEVDGPGGPCVVRASGTVRCAQAPVDPNVPTDQPRPTPAAYAGYDVPGIQDAAAISGSPGHTCVLRRTGTVVCWGDGRFGQLGDGPAPLGHGPQFVPTPVAGLVAPTD